MSRTPRPVNEDRASAAIAVEINDRAAQEKPCPTIRDLMDMTGLPRRRVKAFLKDMSERGVIEIEEKGPGQRRMRVFGRPWTDWSRDLSAVRAKRWASHAGA